MQPAAMQPRPSRPHYNALTGAELRRWIIMKMLDVLPEEHPAFSPVIAHNAPRVSVDIKIETHPYEKQSTFPGKDLAPPGMSDPDPKVPLQKGEFKADLEAQYPDKAREQMGTKPVEVQGTGDGSFSDYADNADPFAGLSDKEIREELGKALGDDPDAAA